MICMKKGWASLATRDFFDTNVLVYAISDNEPEKQARARVLLTEAIENNTGTISAQVLGEFFTISTSPLRNGPSAHGYLRRT